VTIQEVVSDGFDSMLGAIQCALFNRAYFQRHRWLWFFKDLGIFILFLFPDNGICRSKRKILFAELIKGDIFYNRNTAVKISMFQFL